MAAMSDAITRTTRPAWIVWGIGVSAYLVAFFHRVTLNVAAGETADRLGVSTGALGFFAFLQLGAYLAMQLPAGFAADRLGPRRTLTLGLLAIVVGEGIFALAHALPLAVAGRILVGVGDAMTFVNVLRLVQSWFPERRQALLAALTGVMGGIGSLVATIPLEASLTDLGWTGTFAITIGVAAALAVVAYAVLRDRPPGVPAPLRDDHPAVGRTIAAAWHRPTTRRAFYAHAGALGPFAAVGTIWGVPYLERTQGVDGATAASHMLAVGIAFTACIPFVGLTGHWPPRARAALLVVPGLLQTATLVVLLAWPGTEAPEVLVVGMLALVGLGGAVSISCFDIARRGAPRETVGMTVAIVNSGGFTAAAIGSAIIGLLLAGDPSDARIEHAILGVLIVMTAFGFTGSMRLARDIAADHARDAARVARSAPSPPEAERAQPAS
jgi:predicted MFS family arabinose efflux permease